MIHVDIRRPSPNLDVLVYIVPEEGEPYFAVDHIDANDEFLLFRMTKAGYGKVSHWMALPDDPEQQEICVSELIPTLEIE